MQRFEYILQKKKSSLHFKLMKKDACKFSLVLDHSRNDHLLSFFEHISPFLPAELLVRNDEEGCKGLSTICKKEELSSF